MFEIFNPKDGNPIGYTRFAFIARFICRICPVLDYEKAGKGW